MESPSASQTIAAPKTIQCPQCKAEIHLQRPRSLIVQAAGQIEKALRSLLLPSAVLGTSYGAFLISTHHGIWTIQQVFGMQDARRILRPLFESTVIQVTRMDHLLGQRAARHLEINWTGLRLALGIPMIPFALILSRTSLLDPVFPILPILFFATHSEQSASLDTNIWPPSAAFTVAMLPYVRTLYDECMERAFGWREREWLKVIQPQLGEPNEPRDQNGEGEEAENAADAAGDGDADVLQVEVDIEIEDTDSEADEPEVAGQEQQAGDEAAPPPIARERGRTPNLNAPPQDEQRAQVQENLLRHIQNERGNNQRRNDGQRRRNVNAGDIVLTASRATELVVGALAFPSICGLAGEAMRFVLPASWVTPTHTGGKTVPTGLLQTKWGRSIIGGCLMVMLKDAVRIYCRWKMAQAHRNRRVKNYDKKTGKIVDVRGHT